MLAQRSNIDDTRRFALHQHRQEQPGQQKAGEVVDSKSQLVAVGAHLPQPTGSAGADACIVDENVNSAKLVIDFVGQSADIGKCREIGAVERRSTAASSFNAVNQAL